jgi:hypothetical protein
MDPRMITMVGGTPHLNHCGRGYPVEQELLKDDTL